MATVPEDIQEGLKKLSDAVDVPVKSLFARMKEIMTDIKGMGETEKDKGFKIRVAWGALCNEFSSRGKTEDFLVMPVFTPRASERKVKGKMTWIGNLTALVQKLEKQEDGSKVKGDITYGAGTFWRDGGKNILKMEKGKVYRAQLIANENNSGWLSITSDRAVFTPVDDKLRSFEDFFKNEIMPKEIMISLSELDLNKSEDNTDIRVIRATVIDADIAEDKNGREYGFYTVMDDTIIGSNQRFFVSPEEVCWRQGSVLYFGGTISRNDDTGVVRFDAQFIVPTDIAMPAEYRLEPVPTPPEQETVDLSDDSDEKKDEKKTEESSKESKKEDKKAGKTDFEF